MTPEPESLASDFKRVDEPFEMMALSTLSDSTMLPPSTSALKPYTSRSSVAPPSIEILPDPRLLTSAWKLSVEWSTTVTLP